MGPQIMILFFNMWLRKYNNKQKGKNKMYIDKYKVEIKGSKYHEKTDKRMKDQVLAIYQSDDGMNIKALKNILEELADSHDANHNISFNIVMKQYDHD